MKRLLTIALVVSGFSSPLGAFDIDVTRAELLERFGVFTISDLALGQTGLASANNACHSDGKLYIYNALLRTDRKFNHFEVELQPNGQYKLTFVNNDWDEQPQENIGFNAVAFRSCNQQTMDAMGGILPVESVDGFSSYSEWLDHMLTTYEIDDR